MRSWDVALFSACRKPHADLSHRDSVVVSLAHIPSRLQLDFWYALCPVEYLEAPDT
jgi:hypothetical protein